MLAYLAEAGQRVDALERTLGLATLAQASPPMDLTAWSQELRRYMHAHEQEPVRVAGALIEWLDDLLRHPVDTRGYRYEVHDPGAAWGAFSRAAAGCDVRAGLIRMLCTQVPRQIGFGFIEGAWWSVQQALGLARDIITAWSTYLGRLQPAEETRAGEQSR